MEGLGIIAGRRLALSNDQPRQERSDVWKRVEGPVVSREQIDQSDTLKLS